MFLLGALQKYSIARVQRDCFPPLFAELVDLGELARAADAAANNLVHFWGFWAAAVRE